MPIAGARPLRGPAWLTLAANVRLRHDARLRQCSQSYGIVQVESWWSFALKICTVIAATNAVGVACLACAARSARLGPAALRLQVGFEARQARVRISFSGGSGDAVPARATASGRSASPTNRSISKQSSESALADDIRLNLTPSRPPGASHVVGRPTSGNCGSSRCRPASSSTATTMAARRRDLASAAARQSRRRRRVLPRTPGRNARTRAFASRCRAPRPTRCGRRSATESSSPRYSWVSKAPRRSRPNRSHGCHGSQGSHGSLRTTRISRAPSFGASVERPARRGARRAAARTASAPRPRTRRVGVRYLLRRLMPPLPGRVRAAVLLVILTARRLGPTSAASQRRAPDAASRKERSTPP